MELLNKSQLSNATLNLETGEFTLPVGYTDENGRVHTLVKLKPMTGAVEEAMSDPKVRENGGKVVTELILGVIESLGSLKKVTRDVVRKLSAIDRDFILVMNRRYSIGEVVNYLGNCTECGGKNDINADLGSLEVNYLGEEDERTITFPLVHGVKNRADVVCKNVTIRLADGAIQERIAPIMRINPAQAMTAMLQMITVDIEGVEFLDPDVFKNMTKKDRDLIAKKMSEIVAGVKLEITVVCAECGKEFTSVIPVTSLLGE